MALLERFRDDVGPDPVALTRARRRLLRRALVAGGAAPRRRRAVVASVAAATLLVLGGVALVAGTGPSVSPAAASVLGRGADVAESRAVPGPDQYLHLRQVTTRWESDGITVERGERWIPGEPSDPRVVLVPFFAEGPYLDTEALPAIYTDPEAGTEDVLAWLRRPSGDLRDDEAALSRAGEVLASGASPPSFQAAVLRALQEVDGVEVVDEEADFGGRRATIIGRDEPHETQFAFDAATGRLLGYQGAANPEVGGPLSYRTVVTGSVVDRLPARARGAVDAESLPSP